MRTAVLLAVSIGFGLGLGTGAQACDRNASKQHSLRGVVDEVRGSELVVRSSGGSQAVLLTDNTVIRSGRAAVSSTALRPGMAVVIEGRRSARQLEARKIWVMEESGPERANSAGGTTTGGHRH